MQKVEDKKVVTITEVAKEAGVSVATVSRVLNGESCVRENTAKRVTDAIEKLNYVPNVAARNLRRNESRMLIVIADNFTNPYYAKVLSGIGEAADEAGYNLMMCATNGKENGGHRYIRMLKNGLADGAVLLNCTQEDIWLKSYVGKYPMVQGCECVNEFDTLKVLIDHWKMGYEGTKYLAGLGHKRIAYISAENRLSSTLERYRGYCEAMRELGLDQGDELHAVADWNYSFESGCRCARELLSQDNPPTAILCVSDTIAIGVLRVAHELGFQVPGDLSVVGCDDIEFSTMMHPFLTTFHIPDRDMGRACVELLISQIQDKVTRRQICIDMALMLRETTGKPSAR